MTGTTSKIAAITGAITLSGGPASEREFSTSRMPDLNEDRSFLNTGLGKLSLLDDYGPGFSDAVKTYARTLLQARAEGRQPNHQENLELKRIEGMFAHSMAPHTLRLVAGHMHRLLACDQKLSRATDPSQEASIRLEAEKVFIDIDKRLGLLSQWLLQAKEMGPFAMMAQAAYAKVGDKLSKARYSQKIHSDKWIDCSGLVGEYLTQLLKEAGHNVDLRQITTAHLYNINNKRYQGPLMDKLRKYFDCVNLKELGLENLTAGDAIVRRANGKGHTGVYVGNGEVVHSTRDSDQNGYGVDTLHEFLRRNRTHLVARLKPEFRNPSGIMA